MTTAAVAVVKMTWKQRLWKVTKRWMKILGVLYVVVAVLMYAFQRVLVFPGSLWQGKEDTRTKAMDGETMVELKTTGGVPVVGIFGAADLRHRVELEGTAGEERPTVLYFYGNGDSMVSARPVAEMFRSMGYHAMMVDYAGFGMSGGVASEQGCYDAAEAAYQYVLTRGDVDKKRIVVAGWSLGGAVAIDLAWRHREEGTICGLMTFSTFTSMVAMGQGHYPFLPVGLLLKHRFMSIEKVGELRVPYLLGHGKADDAIPYWHSEKLAGAYGRQEMITRYSSETARHNDFFDVDLSQLEEAMGAFLEKVAK
jgi:hypothetical protein